MNQSTKFCTQLPALLKSYIVLQLNFFKTVFVWFWLIALFSVSVPVHCIAQLTDRNQKAKVLDISSLDENKQTSLTDFTELMNLSKKDLSLAKIIVGGKTVEYAVLQLEYRNVASRRAKFKDSKVSRIKGATVLTVIDRFADIFVESQDGCDMYQLRADPNIVRCEYASTGVIPPPPPSLLPKFRLRKIPETIVRNGYTTSDGIHLTGKNVYIAFIDTGIDFNHPDFITYDADGNPSSRILYLWDTTLDFRPGRGNKAPFSYPNGASIGTVFSQEQLTAELRAIKKGDLPTIPQTDANGHGTAVTGIAAGNGNAYKSKAGQNNNEVIGVAPEASIIGIRIGKKGDDLDNSYLLNAGCEWLNQVSGENPLVISASFGGHYTGHDGQSVNERELNLRLAGGEKKGRAMVVSAGNEGQQAIHAQVIFGNRNNAESIVWEAKEPTNISLFFNTSSLRDIRIVPLENTKIKEYRRLNRITKQIESILSVEAGKGKVQLFNVSGRETEAHLYFSRATAGVFKTGVRRSYLVSAPGTAEAVITIGSSDFNDNFHQGGNRVTLGSDCGNENKNPLPIEIGWLSCYSSPGPARDNRVKPDFIAPGQWYSASYAKNAPRWRIDTTGMYVAMNGTSAATPYVAGLIALLFQKNPSLTTNRVKELFRQNSTKTGLKPFSGKFPNNDWGNGKLDFDAVKRIFISLDDKKAPSK